MDPKVLADALVDAGIGLHTDFGCNEYWPYGYGHKTNKALGGEYAIQYFKSAERAINDWRVAGKVLESWEPRSYSQWILSVATTRLAKILRDPRAIIEAWYATTEQGESDGD